MENQRVMARLREKGFRITPQRLAICEFVLSSREHPTVEQVYHVVRKKHPALSLATVYQTLHLLTEMGLLQELGFSGVSRYDPTDAPHVNIVCKGCGKITDHESEGVKSFLSQVASELGRKPIGQRLELYVYCNKCRKSKS